MTEIVQDGIGILTLRQPDGPGFFHVSFSDGGVTVGCSTGMLPKDCLDVLGETAGDHRDLMEAMRGSAVHWTVQRHDETGDRLEIRQLELTEDERGMSSVAERVATDLPRDVVALRMDIGSSSWQWDDLSSSQWPAQRSFGGLADTSIVDAMLDVMAHVGDRWVRENLEELRPQAWRFVDEHAS